MAISLLTGNTAPAGGTSTVAIVLPSGGTNVDDLLFIAVESANETIATPSGWTQVTNSPQSIGTAAAAGGVRLALFYKWVTVAGAQANVTLADSGNHTVGFSFGFRGVDKTTPIEASAGGTVTTNASLSFPAVTTLTNGAAVVNVFGNDRDILSSTNLSAWTNANLVSITEIADSVVASGVGGGLGVAWGIKTTAGSSGNTTATNAAAVNGCYLTIAIKPSAAAAPLSVDALSYTDTLNSIGLAWNRLLSVDALAFTQTQNSVEFAKGVQLTVDPLAFTQTANAIGFVKASSLSVSNSSYTTTANDINALIGLSLPISSLNYSLNQSDVGLAITKTLSVSPSSYTLTDNNLALVANKSLAISTSSYGSSANAIGLSKSINLPISTNSYSDTLNAVGFVRQTYLSVSPNTYTLTDNNLTLAASKVLSISTNSYSQSLNSVTLSASSAPWQDTTFNNINSTTLTAITDVLSATTGPSGRIQCDLSVSFRPVPLTDGTYLIEGNWQWRTIGGAWNDASSVVSNQIDCVVIGGAIDTLGSLTVNTLVTGLAASTAHEFQFVARRSVASDVGAIQENGASSVYALEAYSLSVSPASYALTANGVGLFSGIKLVVSSSAYSATNNAIALTKSTRLTVSPLSYAKSHSSIGFNGSATLTITPVSYTMARPVIDFALTSNTSKIFIGSNKVTKIHIGGVTVTRVHVGSVRVF